MGKSAGMSLIEVMVALSLLSIVVTVAAKATKQMDETVRQAATVHKAKSETADLLRMITGYVGRSNGANWHTLAACANPFGLKTGCADVTIRSLTAADSPVSYRFLTTCRPVPAKMNTLQNLIKTNPDVMAKVGALCLPKGCSKQQVPVTELYQDGILARTFPASYKTGAPNLDEAFSIASCMSEIVGGIDVRLDGAHGSFGGRVQTVKRFGTLDRRDRISEVFIGNW